MPPITAAELMAARPSYVDHPCQAWLAPVRLVRLAAARYVALSELYQTYDRDEAGQVSADDRYAWAVEVVAASVIDAEGNLQFADGAPKKWLADEPCAVSELVQVAMRLSGLGTATEEAEPDAGAEKKSTS